ncbi:DUF4097 family beta strand repeat-containing protein, partial [Brevibacillus porteri]
MRITFNNLLSASVALGLVLFTSACTFDSGLQNTSASFKEKSYAVDAEKINQMSLTASDSTVELVESSDHQIHINYFENDKEVYEIDVSDKKELIMKAVTDKNLKDYFGLDADKAHHAIKIAVPSGIVCGIKILTSKGDIVFSSVDITGSVDAVTSNGKIEVTNIAVDKILKLETKNDDIILSEVNIKGSVDASLSNGNIEVTKVAVDDALKLKTKNGDITGTVKG